MPGAETGNEFQGIHLETKWIFTAVRENIPSGVLPKTGSDIDSTFYYSIGLFLMGAGAFGVHKFKGEFLS